MILNYDNYLDEDNLNIEVNLEDWFSSLDKDKKYEVLDEIVGSDRKYLVMLKDIFDDEDALQKLELIKGQSDIIDDLLYEVLQIDGAEEDIFKSYEKEILEYFLPDALEELEVQKSNDEDNYFSQNELV